MEWALYEPRHGYYSAGPERRIGRGGDFYTSVSVGEMFGKLLALRLAGEWRDLFGKTLPLVVVEQGGHDGRLARDFLAGLDESAPDLAEGVEYRLVEPREPLRGALRDRLVGGGGDRRLTVVPSLEEARAPAGLFLCNELLDAFPVDTLVFRKGRWHERWVAAKEGPDGRSFVWVERTLREEYAAFAGELGTDFPEGYETEICPAVDEWAGEVSTLFQKGLWWIFDYGHERSDYYDPSRRTGTLRAYRNHRASDDLFAFPGEQDLTADVDFTRVERAVRKSELECRRFTDQHHFLIEAARPWLLAIEGRPPEATTATRLRQFKTLTHPGLMGRQFKVMELSRGLAGPDEDSPGGRFNGDRARP